MISPSPPTRSKGCLESKRVRERTKGSRLKMARSKMREKSATDARSQRTSNQNVLIRLRKIRKKRRIYPERRRVLCQTERIWTRSTLMRRQT